MFIESQVEGEEVEENSNTSQSKSGYDYLLGMSMWVLTKEKVEELSNDRDSKQSGILLPLYP